MLQRRRAWKSWTPFSLVLAILLLTWVIFESNGGRDSAWSDALEPLSWVSGVLSLLVSVVLSRRQENPGRPHVQLDEAASRLADRVLSQSQAAAKRLQLENPRALAVRYRAAPDELYDRWENIQRAPDDTDAPRTLLAGSFETIHHTYSAIQSGRLLVLGKPGGGKTVLAHQLILSLLDGREPSSPVPVLLSLGKWEPSTSSLADWLVEQVLRDHPHLNGKDPTREDSNLAEALVRRSLILPVLDGFDEISDGYYHHAITKINEWVGPVVVTSRPAQYVAATRGAKVLSRAAGVAVDDLVLEEAERYLGLSATKERASAWKHVFDWIRNTPSDEPARQRLDLVLRTPLMVSLARTVYNDTSGRAPGELLDGNQFPTSKALEDHLLSAYLTIRYEKDHDGGGTPSWGPEQARRWFGYLSTVRSPDLAWWQLSAPLRRVSRVLVMGVVGMLTGGIIGLLSYALGDILEFGVIYGGQSPVPKLQLNLDLVHTEIWTGLAVGLAVGLFNVVKTRSGRSGSEPERLRLRIWPQAGGAPNARGTLISFAGDVVFGLVLGLVVGIVSVLAWSFRHGFGQVYGMDLVHWVLPSVYSDVYSDAWYLQYAPGLVPTTMKLEADLVFGCSLGILIGVGYALVNVVVHFLGDSVDRTRVVDPWESLATDRTITLVRVVLVGLMAGLVVGFAVGYSYYSSSYTAWEEAVDRGTNYGALYGSYAALIRLLPSAWGTWLVYVRLWLPLTRRLPWRPKTFLQDAHERQVFRHAGAAYQFRHVRLREYLAEMQRSRASEAESETRSGTFSSTTK